MPRCVTPWVYVMPVCQLWKKLIPSALHKGTSRCTKISFCPTTPFFGSKQYIFPSGPDSNPWSRAFSHCSSTKPTTNSSDGGRGVRNHYTPKSPSRMSGKSILDSTSDNGGDHLAPSGSSTPPPFMGVLRPSASSTCPALVEGGGCRSGPWPTQGCLGPQLMGVPIKGGLPSVCAPSIKAPMPG